jgi:3-oxoacyl-[acyl-carrier-protein] synthase III
MIFCHRGDSTIRSDILCQHILAALFDIFNALLAAMSAKSQVDSLVTMRLSLIPVREVTLSRIVDWKDRSTAILFGDGAGAVILEGSEETGILHSKLFSDGNYLSSE